MRIVNQGGMQETIMNKMMGVTGARKRVTHSGAAKEWTEQGDKCKQRITPNERTRKHALNYQAALQGCRAEACRREQSRHHWRGKACGAIFGPERLLQQLCESSASCRATDKHLPQENGRRTSKRSNRCFRCDLIARERREIANPQR